MHFDCSYQLPRSTRRFRRVNKTPNLDWFCDYCRFAPFCVSLWAPDWHSSYVKVVYFSIVRYPTNWTTICFITLCGKTLVTMFACRALTPTINKSMCFLYILNGIIYEYYILYSFELPRRSGHGTLAGSDWSDRAIPHTSHQIYPSTSVWRRSSTSFTRWNPTYVDHTSASTIHTHTHTGSAHPAFFISFFLCIIQV